MRRRHPLPTIWLMTDSRIGDLPATIRRLPQRSGIIFRHYHLPRPERRALFKQVAKLAKARGHTLLLADRPMVARQWGADGAHDRSAHRSRGIRTVAVHNIREAVQARRVNADLIFVSPVFATQSHADARGIGVRELARIAGKQCHKTIALGGMTAKRMKRLCALNLHGWAAINAFRT
jgi:thiamine-phosphate pyrophosphorylase